MTMVKPGLKIRFRAGTRICALGTVLVLALAGFQPVAAKGAGVRFKDEVFAEVRVTKDVLYLPRPGIGRDGQGLRLDIYEPAGDSLAARPLMVWVHGGGFYRGGKTDEWMTALAEHFARCGFVCASIEYRLLLGGPKDWLKPEDLRRAAGVAVEDARAALCHLVGHAKSYRLDPAEVILGGGSAGAFVALQAAAGGEDRRCEAKVRAVIDFWGGLVDVSSMKPGFPPLLIIHGTQDRTVPFSSARRLAARASEVGVTCVLRPIEGEGHAPWEHLKTYLAWVHEFLGRIPFDRRP